MYIVNVLFSVSICSDSLSQLCGACSQNVSFLRRSEIKLQPSNGFNKERRIKEQINMCYSSLKDSKVNKWRDWDISMNMTTDLWPCFSHREVLPRLSGSIVPTEKGYRCVVLLCVLGWGKEVCMYIWANASLINEAPRWQQRGFWHHINTLSLKNSLS